MNRFISKCCKGEKCQVCGGDAAHKIEETIFADEPKITFVMGYIDRQMEMEVERHPYTAYLCHTHFVMVMGPATL